jgi:hypothetical protein
VAPAVFKTVAGRLASRVGSIPIHSRHCAHTPHRRRTVTFRIVRAPAGGVVGAVLFLSVASGCPAHGQRLDTTQAGVSRAQRARPPLSPRRAFLSSLVAPGYAQSVLGRPNAAALFVLTEAIGVLMVREAAIALRQARRLQTDSVPVYFVNPTTGAPDTVFALGRYSAALVRSRRAHLEDWIAALVANHLIAGADAFVAAHLWDVPAQVGLRSGDGRMTLAARLTW